MKTGSSRSLNTRLFVFPVAALLLIFVAGGLSFYYFSPSGFLKDFYKLHIVDITSEKKTAVDMWFQHFKKEMENLSKNRIIRDNMVFLNKPPVNSGKADAKIASLINKEVQARTSKALEDAAASSNCRLVAILSLEGVVVSSSRSEIAGENWSDKPLVKDIVAAPKPEPVTGFYGNGTQESGIVYITPVYDQNEKFSALIYSVSDTDKIAGLLRMEVGLYKSGKTELIDAEGNLLLTKKGIPERKLRYNIPKNTKTNAVMLRDSLFFYVLPLDSAPFRLIMTVEKKDAMKPLAVLIMLFAAFAGLMLLVLIMQKAYLVPKFFTRPLSKLIHAGRAVASGNLDADWGKSCTGELLQLKTTLETMAGEWKFRESMLKEEARAEAKELKPALYETMSNEIKAPLEAIIARTEVMLEDTKKLSGDAKRMLLEVVDSARGALSLVDGLYDLSRLEERALEILPEEFNMCRLLKDVENNTRRLIGTKEIELIIECSEKFIEKPVFTDSLRFKQILESLLKYSVRATDAGTLTVLLTDAVRDGVDYIEVSVADTGRGIESGLLEKISGAFAYSSEYLELALAIKLTEALGGAMEIESEPEKGSVFTIKIPTRAVIY